MPTPEKWRASARVSLFYDIGNVFSTGNRYAFTGVAGATGGPTTGARGNLRDSDATPSRNGSPLWNWAVHFDAPIP